MTSPPCFQSNRKPRVNRLKSRSLEKDIWKSGLASPTLPSVPKIWVAELSSSIWNAPSEVPKPPVWKAGTDSWVILLRLAKNVVRKSQFTSWLWIGETVSAASTPRFRSLLSELKIRLSCPGSARGSAPGAGR